jgi:hypothetical protein
VISDQEWASFDRMVGVMERAHVERARRRAEVLLDRWPSDDREEFLADLVTSLRSSRAYVDEAWRRALALQRAAGRPSVIDLREPSVQGSR